MSNKTRIQKKVRKIECDKFKNFLQVLKLSLKAAGKGNSGLNALINTLSSNAIKLVHLSEEIKNLSSDIKTNTTINSIGVEKSNGNKTYIDEVKVDLTANQTIKLSNL